MLATQTETISYEIPSFLCGKLVLYKGVVNDYRALERFHYRARSPATWVEVWTVRYVPEDVCRLGFAEPYARTVAAAVVSYPTLACHMRDAALNLVQMTPKAKVRWVNRNVRTISRVAVHPQFRSLGLASALVRCVLYHCKTRYTEALAVMGRAHPFFEKAGMQLRGSEEGRPWYYLFDRHEHPVDWTYPRLETPKGGTDGTDHDLDH